jgi:hypothetical protein
MSLDFWAKTSGTWINILTVLVGTSLGLLLYNRLPLRMQQILTQGIGLLTLWLGTSMAGKLAETKVGRFDGVILGLVAITLGGILGEWWRVEDRLTYLGEWLKQRVRGKGRFTEGFVAASLLFCIGPITILGCLNNGLTGDNTLLILKAVMDGIASIAFASTYGIGVGFSALVVGVVQGALSLMAGTLATVLPDPLTDPRILLITGVGGLMITGIGLNFLEVTKIRIGSFLPAIAIVPFIHWLANRF